VQLVHNHTILHDRTGFEDWPEPERGGHLLRSVAGAPTRRARCPRSSPSANGSVDHRRPRRHHRARHQAQRATRGGVER
jgi:hypothetical protein